MAMAARESLDVAGRTERLARWVVLFARLVVGVAALILALALVSLVVFLAQGRGSAVVTGAGSLAGVAVFLLVQAVFLALIGRYAQLRAADVRASRAYEAAVAAALADLLRKRDAAAASTAVASDPVAAGPGVEDPIVTPAVVAAVAALETTTDVSDGQATWHPHSHSAEAAAVESRAATSEPVLTVHAALAAEQAAAQQAVVAVPVVTETVVPEPAVAEPVVTEPVVTVPVVTEPAVAEPVVTEAVVTEAVVTEPAVAEPVVTVPVVTVPVVTEPAVAEPAVAETSVQAPAQTGTVAAAVSTVAVSPETGLPVAGWYPDPAGPGQRWWDGLQWTTATR